MGVVKSALLLHVMMWCDCDACGLLLLDLAQLKLFYDPVYESDRERVVDALSAETELPKDYVSKVFDKAKQLGAMDMCYQTAVCDLCAC
jgi:hypothetical protein